MLRSALVMVALLGSSHVAGADDFDPLYSCHVPPAGTKLSASFKPDTSLRDLATWVTGFTCKNIVFSSDVPKNATRVTIISPNKMTAKQALALFVDAVEATGLVVQIKPDTIIIKLGPKMPKGCPDTTVSSSDANVLSPWPGDSPAPASETDLVELLDKNIKKLDDTHYEITAEALDAVMANPMAVAKGARMVPSVKNGKPDGFKLYAIRPMSLWSRLGFANGDTLQTVNGMSLDTAEKALETYSKLREAKKLDVAITRRGNPLTISITVKR